MLYLFAGVSISFLRIHQLVCWRRLIFACYRVPIEIISRCYLTDKKEKGGLITYQYFLCIAYPPCEVLHIAIGANDFSSEFDSKPGMSS